MGLLHFRLSDSVLGYFLAATRYEMIPFKCAALEGPICFRAVRLDSLAHRIPSSISSVFTAAVGSSLLNACLGGLCTFLQFPVPRLLIS